MLQLFCSKTIHFATVVAIHLFIVTSMSWKQQIYISIAIFKRKYAFFSWCYYEMRRKKKEENKKRRMSGISQSLNFEGACAHVIPNSRLCEPLEHCLVYFLFCVCVCVCVYVCMNRIVVVMVYLSYSNYAIHPNSRAFSQYHFTSLHFAYIFFSFFFVKPRDIRQQSVFTCSSVYTVFPFIYGWL